MMGQSSPLAAADVTYELGLTLAAMGSYAGATKVMRDVTARAPGHAAAWRKLAELLRLAAEDVAAQEAETKAAEAVTGGVSNAPPAVDGRPPAQLVEAERALQATVAQEPRPQAMQILRERLFHNPTDAVAMRLLAHQEWGDGDEATAFCLLDRVLDLAPDYAGARRDFAQLLAQRNCHARALIEIGRLMTDAPHDMMYRTMQADLLRNVGNLPAALSIIEALIGEHPDNPRFRCVYAQALHFAGRRDDSVASYRACLDLAPTMGEAYWGLAELKGNFLTRHDVASMRKHLDGFEIEPPSRLLMLYALGRALENEGDFAGSFAAYEAGACLFRDVSARTGGAYDAAKASDQVRRRKETFTAAHLAARAAGAQIAATPIFIVGMPRAGSTLVEQILASHSLVEATLELPVLPEIIRDLTRSRIMITPSAYPECVADLSPGALAALGARYIELACAYRTTSLPYFIDKRPWNWLDAGLIHLILPHARIIDVRRAPMAACFAMFKQILPDEAAFSYDLNNLAHYYKEYVAMMAHYDAVLPGRIHHVPYESLVDDTETEIRRLLAYCGLPFEESCLRFWQTDRTVATPSAEQVRRPIFRDALELWRHYEPWLGPLKAALAEK
jgi:tetratricopeptide (TPR) repeat protein